MTHGLAMIFYTKIFVTETLISEQTLTLIL